MKSLALLLTVIALLVVLSCTKNNPVSPDSTTGCQPETETWTLSGGLSGTMTITRDSACNLTVSGTAVTNVGDTILFTSVSLTLAAENMDFTAAQAIVVQGNVACTLVVSGSALEGVGSGSFTLTFISGAGNTSGTFSATRESGSGLTASAASISARGSIPQTNQVDVSSYIADGTTLTLIYSEMFSYAYCDWNDSLIQNTNTYSDSTQFTYVLSATSLVLSFYISSQNPVVTFTYSFVRETSGSGLVGNWIINDCFYTLVSGELTPDQTASLDADAEERKNSGVRLQITDTQVIATMNTDPDDYSWADSYITNWNAYDSSLYNVTIVKINDNTIKLVGNTTGEVVLLTADADQNITYISSDYLHERTMEYQEPTTCPNPLTDWFYAEFLNDNTQEVLFRRPLAAPGPVIKKPAARASLLFKMP
ncbi:MAG: hypothetical protein A2248_22760 [Candidatus Raymondbacteria bacterium RIFOXYA2_FULL_49_16]|nr:MAG: hypothetical protein A2248_22760 [Candidatus Raymondbacteria bacterium RIFOXYA2_FULL_49_16]